MHHEEVSQCAVSPSNGPRQRWRLKGAGCPRSTPSGQCYVFVSAPLIMWVWGTGTRKGFVGQSDVLAPLRTILQHHCPVGVSSLEFDLT